MNRHSLVAVAAFLAATAGAFAQATPEQLQKVLQKYPAADANGDGVLTLPEALAYRDKMKGGQKAGAQKPAIAPTLANVSYADDPDCLLDFWKADEAAPAPLIIYIHGGGFVGGNKEGLSAGMIEYARSKGFAVASLAYPFLDRKPIQDILRLCGRAVQYARANAVQWNIDPQRIACMGTSAGAGTSLWIATHPDLADPSSSDPVARQSSRIQAAAMLNGQATYDVARWPELLGPADDGWKKNPEEDLNFYHFAKREDMDSEQGRAVRAEVDMYGMLDAKTPPLFLFGNKVVNSPMDRGSYIHHPKHEEAVAAKAKALGIPVELVVGAGAAGKNGNNLAIDFFATHLKSAPPAN